jgi:hypothetical protein
MQGDKEQSNHHKRELIWIRNWRWMVDVGQGLGKSLKTLMERLTEGKLYIVRMHHTSEAPKI